MASGTDHQAEILPQESDGGDEENPNPDPQVGNPTPGSDHSSHPYHDFFVWLGLKIADVVADFLLVVIVISVYPFVLLAIGFLSWPPDKKKEVSREAEGIEAIYKQSQYEETLATHIAVGSLKLLSLANLLLWVWLILNLSVPMLKRLTLMGSPLWRWSLLALIIIAAFHAAMHVYWAPVVFKTVKIMIKMKKVNNFETETEVKQADLEREVSQLQPGYLYTGLMWSAIFVIDFGMILVSWVLYFGTEQGLKNDSFRHPEAFKYVTWTCVSLFVGSVLWLLKNFFLLRWSADAIYGRFEPMILITAAKFFYLGIIIGSFRTEIFWPYLKVVEEYYKQSPSTNFNFTKYIMSRKLSNLDLQIICKSFTSLAALVTSQEEDGITMIIKYFQARITQTHEICDVDSLQSELLRFNKDESLVIHPETARVLHGIVREQYASDQFTFDDLKKWMVDAHINCINMGRTLADAQAIVTRIDIFLSFILVTVVVLLWLLITEFATTKILVTIATPILALTFIFGDSAKAFFQGIIFYFSTHPFDVGDLCIVDETELEVKNISILTTTFIKIGSAEKRMYPNSILATKAIVNLGWQPNLTDVVELTLDSSISPKTLEALEKLIDKYFKDPTQKGCFDQNHEVMMKEIGEKIKVTVHFKHVLNIEQTTHGQCFQKKNKQRSELLKKIHSILNEIIANPNSPSVSENVQSGGQVELKEARS